MIRKTTLTALSLVLLALAACGRGGPPAPVEIRGIGTGETSPGAATRGTSSSASSVQGSSYTPPPGYGSAAARSASSGSIQTQTLGEPNDAYAQAATQPAPAQDIRINPPPVGANTVNNVANNTDAVRASQPGQPQVLGTMPANTPVTRGVPVAPETAAPAAPAATSSAAASTAPIDQGSGSFGWPIRGRVISNFGDKPNGQANDGLNIAAPLGTQVLAAKDGTVAYAGNELRSFGNMVLVRHPGGMFTVYAHLDQILVTKDAPITKGQVVGTVGQSGGVSEPQLHFEVRRGSNPQDPMKYLSR